MKKLRNENGLTLVELLAVLALSTIVIGLLITALITIFRHNDTTQSHIDLRQEANIILTKLRTVHEKDELNLDERTYFLFYNQADENIFIVRGKDETEPLASPRFAIKGLEKKESGEGVMIKSRKGENDECLKDLDFGTELVNDTELVDNRDNILCVSRDEPLIVTIVLSDKENKKTFEIDTVVDHVGTAMVISGKTGTDPELDPPPDLEEPNDPDPNPEEEDPDPNDPGGEDPDLPPGEETPPEDGGSCPYQQCEKVKGFLSKVLCYVGVFLSCTVEEIIQALETLEESLAAAIRSILEGLGIKV